MTIDCIPRHLLLARLESRSRKGHPCRRWIDSVRFLTVAQGITMERAVNNSSGQRGGWIRIVYDETARPMVLCPTLHSNSRIE